MKNRKERFRKYFRKYKEDVIGKSLFELVKFFFLYALVFPFLSGVLSFLFSLGGIVFILTAIITTIIFIVIFGKVRFSNKSKFKILKINVTFEYLGDKVITTSEVTAKAKRAGLDKMYNHYTWFDDEKSSIRCLTKNFKIQRLKGAKDTNKQYNVLFDRILKKNEIVIFKVRVIGENKNKHFKNFYTREIIAPTDNLCITLIIPSVFNVTKIKKSINGVIPKKGLIDEEEISFLGTYTWDISFPVIGYEYTLSW